MLSLQSLSGFGLQTFSRSALIRVASNGNKETDANKEVFKKIVNNSYFDAYSKKSGAKPQICSVKKEFLNIFDSGNLLHFFQI